LSLPQTMRVARRCGTLQALRRGFANTKVASPPLVVITGEEFTRYAGVRSDQQVEKFF
jgi:hypothetical protein